MNEQTIKEGGRMETLKKKILAVAVAATLGTGVSFAAPGTGEGAKKTPAKSSYAKDKSNIEKRASSIAYHEARIEELKAQLKANKKADNELAVVSDRQNLCKAKADLRREKAYLKADKRALKQNHSVAIKTQKQEMREDRAELRKTKRQLRRDIRQDNEAAVVAGAAAFAKKSREVEASEMALENHRDAMDADMAWVDEVTDDDYAATGNNNRVAVRQSRGDLDEQQADMAYTGARYLIIVDRN